MKRFLSSGLTLFLTSVLACSSSLTAVPDPTLTVTESQDAKSGDQSRSTLKPSTKILESSKETEKVKQFRDAPDLDLFRLSQELVPGSIDLLRTSVKDTKSLSVGHSEAFWLVNFSETETYQSDFTLTLVTPHAYWYVENGLEISMAGLKQSAKQFEEVIYPVITQVFGNEWNPGIDHDPRLNILNAKLSQTGGYFRSTDEFPKSVRPKSNQKEIIYVNAHNVAPGSSNYAQVLSHELQHAIHWNADASEDTWVNEGLSELATSIALNSTSSIPKFLQGPPISLIHWPNSSVSDIAYYGAVSLFMHFFTEHYGGQNDLKGLLAVPEDSISGIDIYLEQEGYVERFADVFNQWAAANILDNQIQIGDSILGYKALEINALISDNINGMGSKQFNIPQYAIEYIELKSISEPFQLSFKGETDTPLLPIDIGKGGCWWSNSGDSINSTLSRKIDVPVGTSAVLEYEVWFEVEEYWDYVYVEVSIDEGKNWQIIKTPETSPMNPIGNSFGVGYTGISGGWLKDSVDLTPFAIPGEAIWVRFQYLTDEAVNAAGACFRNLSVTAAGITSDDRQWEANGFEFTDNIVRQDFQVQLITVGDDPHVRQIPLSANNAGELTSHPPREWERLVVAVGSLAEKTREPASYSISLKPTVPAFDQIVRQG